jgi:Fe-Mn family superoxide dismutase
MRWHPHINSQTLSIHHGKHHAAYVTNGNKLIEGTELAGKSLGDIVKARQARPTRRHLQQRRAGVEPHLLLELDEAEGGGKPTGQLAKKIDDRLRQLREVRRAVHAGRRDAVRQRLGVADPEGGKLEVTKTPNAETPL